MERVESSGAQSVRPAGMSGCIISDECGTYRWVYEFNLFTNPTILLTVAKILGAIVGIGLVLLIGVSVHDYATSNLSDAMRQEQLFGTLRGAVLFVLFFTVLIVVGYCVYAAMQGGKYCVVFTMDENGVTHKQLPKQFEKAQVVGGLNVLAGLAAGSLTQMGVGILAATHDSTTSEFSNVRSIKGSQRLRVIKVNEPLAKNQVYVEPEDYDFVFNFIVRHCPNATKVEG